VERAGPGSGIVLLVGFIPAVVVLVGELVRQAT